MKQTPEQLFEQLSKEFAPKKEKEVMFSDHTYLSGMTKSLQSHFYNTAKENLEDLNLSFDDVVVDIGGNDGTQLLQYKKLGGITG